MKKRFVLFNILIFLFAMVSMAQAVPTFQVYIEGSNAANYDGDQDTWLYNGGTPFTLDVVGAFGPNTVSLTEMYLVVSVPNGQTGTISIQGLGTPSFYTDKSWVPAGENFNNHYPLQEGVSDFFLFSLGAFDNIENINNYNADVPGEITYNDGVGEQREYIVTGITGFTSLHFDVFGLVEDEHGRRYVSSWEISPGSHDSTNNTVPEPSTFLLLGIGILLFGCIAGKRFKKNPKS